MSSLPTIDISEFKDDPSTQTTSATVSISVPTYIILSEYSIQIDRNVGSMEKKSVLEWIDRHNQASGLTIPLENPDGSYNKFLVTEDPQNQMVILQYPDYTQDGWDYDQWKAEKRKTLDMKKEFRSFKNLHLAIMMLRNDKCTIEQDLFGRKVNICKAGPTLEGKATTRTIQPEESTLSSSSSSSGPAVNQGL